MVVLVENIVAGLAVGGGLIGRLRQGTVHRSSGAVLCCGEAGSMEPWFKAELEG
jgi:hypothetical protein